MVILHKNWIYIFLIMINFFIKKIPKRKRYRDSQFQLETVPILSEKHLLNFQYSTT